MGDASSKRADILNAAYKLMLRNGYEGSGIQDIIDNVNITKGCLYYHFKSKQDIAAAVINEIIKPAYEKKWDIASKSDDPLTELCGLIDDIYEEKGDELAKNGCPVGNLALELSNEDEVLSRYVNEVMILWQTLVKKGLDKALSLNIIKHGTDSKKIADFIIGSFEGCIMISKSSCSKDVLENCFSSLKDYINSLRI